MLVTTMTESTNRHVLNDLNHVNQNAEGLKATSSSSFLVTLGPGPKWCS